jgi:heat shock protein HslJ
VIARYDSRMTLHTPAFAAQFVTLALALPLSLVALASVGCQSTGHGVSDASQPNAIGVCLSKLVPSEWTCTQLAQHAFPEGVVPTLTFAAAAGGADDVRVSGFAGVNRYFGPVKQDGSLVFGPLVATRMGGPADRMDLERAYLDMLAKIDIAWMDGDTLRLVDDGVVLATFVRSKS